jgi:hypothetical protein
MLKSKNIQEELKLISPAVADLPNTTPFTVHDQYFEGLTTRILQKVALPYNEEEKDPILSPLLESLKKENPYQLPKDYFQKLSIELNKEKTIPVVQIFAWKKIIGYAVAACLAGIVFLAFFFEKNVAKNELSIAPKTNWEPQPLSMESIQNYLIEADQFQPVEPMGTEISPESNLLVEMTPAVISEILKEIPENDISFYMLHSGGNEMESLN